MEAVKMEGVRREKSPTNQGKEPEIELVLALGSGHHQCGGRACAGVSWLLAPPHELAGAWAGTFLPGLPKLWREAIVR